MPICCPGSPAASGIHTQKDHQLAAPASGRARLAILVMMVTPLLFSTNPVFGRGVVGEVSPFMLAFLRWMLVAVALTPVMLSEAPMLRRLLREHFWLVVLLAFLAMWTCGGLFYFGVARTTAINATLMLTTSPVMVLLIEAVFRGRPIALREGIGTAVAFVGVATIVLGGDPAALLSLDFNFGDLIVLFTAFSWSVYSVLFRAPALRDVSSTGLLGLLASTGAILLLPFALAELATGAALPSSLFAWGGIAGIVLFASLLAFSSYQFGITHLGPSLAALFTYLMPPYGVLLAVLLLGERFHAFHAAGIALVMGGIVMATFPAAWLRERLGR